MDPVQSKWHPKRKKTVKFKFVKLDSVLKEKDSGSGFATYERRFGSGLFISDPNFPIPDPGKRSGSRIRYKEFK
jgi:hypothetical protein